MRFELPALLPLVPLIVGLALGLGRWAESRRLRLAAAWSPALGAAARKARRLSVPLLGGAVLAAALGAAGPRGGRVERVAEGRGLNILLAVDVSRSMLAEDAEPSRLGHATREARRLLQDLPGDRVGVLAFAGASYVLAPLTLDHAAADMYLEALDPDLASTGGTNLRAVLQQGVQVLAAAVEGGDRALVLFTDGEGHDSLPAAREAARALGRDGVRLIVVGEGGVAPARIPLRDPSGAVVEYKRDAEGDLVQTARRDEVLRALAAAAAGAVIPADLPDQAGAIRELLRGLARRPARDRRLSDLVPLGWVGGLLGALVLLLHMVTRRTAALVAVGVVLLGSQPLAAGAQRLSPGHRRLAQGDLAGAEAAFRDQAARGVGGDTAWFNAGTAALAAGRLDPAREALGRAVRTLDPDLRFRALYNLGLANLLAARQPGRDRGDRTREAIERLRAALLLRPDSRNAKWNLELLLGPEPPPASGGGGGGGGGGGSRGRPPPESRLPSGMSQSETAALLASVERDELATRVNAIRRQRLRAAATAKDW